MSADVVRIFIGYDNKLKGVYNVLQHSIISRSSLPVAITPIRIDHVKNVFNRPMNNLQSTEFSFTRFLTPYLAGYKGWAIFMDNDMVVLDDIAKVWAMRDDRYAVMCTKHNHVPKEDVKFLGKAQTQYEKKNWSSFMLMNCGKCEALTPEYVNTASGLDLHRFRWLPSEDLIGDIPLNWNYLADCGQPMSLEKIQNIHYTNGGPYFNEYANCEHANIWFKEREDMLFVQQRQNLK